jgi:hypothetical protein
MTARRRREPGYVVNLSKKVKAQRTKWCHTANDRKGPYIRLQTRWLG